MKHSLYFYRFLSLSFLLAISCNTFATTHTISFSGYSWHVKTCGDEQCGPRPNYFSDSSANVFVDENGFRSANASNKNLAKFLFCKIIPTRLTH